MHEAPTLKLGESSRAPYFLYDFDCRGPDDADREEYLRLLRLAEAQEDALTAAAMRREAEAMVKAKWRETVRNLVTTGGKNDEVTQYFKGTAYTASWFMLLVGAGSISASDTLASHPGWTEQTPYSGTRPAIAFGSASGGSLSATAVLYTFTASATIAGAGICSVASGTSGILYSASDFASTRMVAVGDTLSVTPTVAVS